MEEFYGKDLAKYKLERAREEHHTEKFPKEIGKAISKAAKVRHASDYDDFYIASREEAEKQIQTAEKLIELVNEYITE